MREEINRYVGYICRGLFLILVLFVEIYMHFKILYDYNFLNLINLIHKRYNKC